MCVAIVQFPDSVGLDYGEFCAAWEANPDGAGLAYVRQKALVVVKPMFDVDSAWDKYRAACDKADDDKPMLIHFRIATSGRLDARNTHPHVTAGGHVAVVHNGVLPGGDCQDSDTVYWVRTVCWGRPRKQLMSRKFSVHMQATLGLSKVAMLDSSGNVSILNRALGHEDETYGFWYSNVNHWPASPASIFSSHRTDDDEDHDADVYRREHEYGAFEGLDAYQDYMRRLAE